MSERDVVGVMAALRESIHTGDDRLTDECIWQLAGIAVIQMCRMADAMELIAMNGRPQVPIKFDVTPL